MAVLSFEILNDALRRVGIVEDAISSTWAPEFQGKGSFAFTVPFSVRMRSILVPGYYVTRRDDDNVGIIRRVNLRDDVETQSIIVSGEFAIGILAQRVVMQKSEYKNIREFIVNDVINNNIVNPADEKRKYPHIEFQALLAAYCTDRTFLSRDGRTWEEEDTVFAGAVGSRIATDGNLSICWETPTSSYYSYDFFKNKLPYRISIEPTYRIYCVKFENGYWMITGDTGGGTPWLFARWSTDGQKWTGINYPGNYETGITIAHGDGRFVIMTTDASHCFVHPNIGLLPSPTRPSVPVDNLTNKNKTWVGIGKASGSIVVSEDAFNWSRRDIASGASFCSVEWIDGLWLIAGNKGSTPYVWITHESPLDSADVWTEIPLTSGGVPLDKVVRVMYSGHWIAITAGGQVYYALDDMSDWTIDSAVTLGSFYDAGDIAIMQCAKSPVLGLNVEAYNFFGVNLLTACQQILKNTNTGMRVRLRHNFVTNMPSNLEIQLYDGVDRSASQTVNPRVFFSDTEDNLFSCEYEKSTERIKNVVLVLGEGEGEDKISLTVGEAIGKDRFETAVNAQSKSTENGTMSEAEYAQLLKNTGAGALYYETESFAGTIINTYNYVYRRDYNIGDIITLYNSRLGIYVDTRILGVTETEDDTGYSIIPILGVSAVDNAGETSELFGEIKTKLYADDVINTLSSDAGDKPLSAAMGKVLAGMIPKTLTAQITVGTTWAGETTPYTQIIAVEGIGEEDSPIVDVVIGGDVEATLEEWAKIYKIETADGYITVYAIEPTMAELKIILKVV